MALGAVNLNMSPPKRASGYRIISQASARIVKHDRQQRVGLASDLSVLRVPVALEVGDQRWAEVTIGLLARVDRSIATKQIERLLANSEGATVADGADCLGAGKPIDTPLARRVHLVRRRDLVAHLAPLRTVALQSAFVEDGLSRDAIADEARQ